MKWLRERLGQIVTSAGNPRRPRGKGDEDEGGESPAGALVGELVEATGSYILSGGQWLIQQMRRTTGAGEPENGGRFGQGCRQFALIDETLYGASPGHAWAGSGADGYADQNTRQQVRAETMSDADREVLRVLAQEAWQITYHRGKLDDQYNWLGEFGKYTQYLSLVPRYGQAAKIAAELTAVKASLGLCAFELNLLRGEVAENAGRLQQIVGRYASVNDAVLRSGGAAGERSSDRAPIHIGMDVDPDRLTTPVMVKLDRENPPGPTVTTP